MTTPQPPSRDGYTIATQGSTLPGNVLSYSITRDLDGVGLGAFFDPSPGGDIDQAIARDRVKPLP